MASAIKRNIFVLKFLTDTTRSHYSRLTLAKSSVGRQNLNYNHMADNTRLSACFFISVLHLPKRDPFKKCDLFPMVACGGQRSIVGCYPCEADSDPVTRYRPSVRTQAVTSNKNHMELIAMIYLFAGILRLDRTNKIHSLRIQADSERQARAVLARDYVLAFAGQINHTFAPTAAKTVQGVRYE